MRATFLVLTTILVASIGSLPAIAQLPPGTVIGTYDGAQAEITMDYQLLKQRLEKEFQSLGDIELTEIRIQQYGNNVWILEGTGQLDRQQFVRVGMYLDITTDGDVQISQKIAEKHSCVGAPCSSCTFLIDPESGTITGCLCMSGGEGMCNHTVEVIIYED